jgi:hypothetical protein
MSQRKTFRRGPAFQSRKAGFFQMEGVSISQQSEIRLHVQIREKFVICTVQIRKKKKNVRLNVSFKYFASVFHAIRDDQSRMTQKD